MSLARVALLVAAVACKQRSVPRDAALLQAGASRGEFQLTYYWVSSEADLPGKPNTKIFDRQCKALATTSEAFAKQLAIAGTGQLVDGRTLTVHGECACPRSPCFRVLATEHTWGIGAENRALVPFRSLAVDRSVIPIGTRLWVEQIEGATLPGTFPTVHDGCVVADDVGGGVTGAKIDWFVGQKIDYAELDAALHLTMVTVHDGGARCP